MPVTVECEITPSKQRWLYLILPVLSGALFLILIKSWLALAIWFASIFAIRSILITDFQPSRFRLQGCDVSLWSGDETSEWLWQGKGRCSHAFVQWDLLDEQSQTLKLRIWKDSVSDASWRALNMAFRVNQQAAVNDP